jgi:diamine N-acetyltransferase
MCDGYRDAMPIPTRLAVPGDAADLHTLAAATFGLAVPPGTPQSDVDAFVARYLSRANFEDYLKADDRIIVLAEEGGTPIGYAMLFAGPIADPDARALVPAAGSIELSKFYVLAGNHGRGVAGDLMRATLAAAAGTGATSCWLGVNQQNARAAAFYAKHGFEVIGTKRFLVGERWHDDHVRLRPLP